MGDDEHGTSCRAATSRSQTCCSKIGDGWLANLLAYVPTREGNSKTASSSKQATSTTSQIDKDGRSECVSLLHCTGSISARINGRRAVTEAAHRDSNRPYRNAITPGIQEHAVLILHRALVIPGQSANCFCGVGTSWRCFRNQLRRHPAHRHPGSASSY